MKFGLSLGGSVENLPRNFFRHGNGDARLWFAPCAGCRVTGNGAGIAGNH